MKAILTFAVVVGCSVGYGQHPYAVPPGYGYWNRDEALRQQQFENQLRWRQQQAWEARNPERNYVLDFAEQATLVLANKEQEMHYQLLNEQMRRERRPSRSPFYNPFVR